MLNFNNIRPNRRVAYAHLLRAEHYEYLGDGLDIQIHSMNQRFIKCIKEAYGRLKENPIGIRLVEDIRRLRMDKKDPCWIVECNKQDADGVEIPLLDNSSFLFKTEDQIADLIYINIDQNFHYYGFYKEDLKGKWPNEIIPLQKFISDPGELDITLFHEMNHYRHYLQIGVEEYICK